MHSTARQLYIKLGIFHIAMFPFKKLGKPSKQSIRVLFCIFQLHFPPIHAIGKSQCILLLDKRHFLKQILGNLHLEYVLVRPLRVLLCDLLRLQVVPAVEEDAEGEEPGVLVHAGVAKDWKRRKKVVF